MPLTIQAAANDLLSKLGIEGTDPTVAPALAQQDVIIALNSAGQMLQRAGEDYFTRQTISIALTAGTAAYLISEQIQNVLGPVRLNGVTPLAALLSRGELDRFDQIFNGNSDFGSGTGTPIAYWVESLNNTDTFGDIMQYVLWLAPVPSTSPTVTLDVVDLFPSISAANIGSLQFLPVAHGYAESIFLPLARLFVTRSSQFSRADLLKQITDDAGMALDQLASGGGFPDMVRPNKPERMTHG